MSAPALAVSFGTGSSIGSTVFGFILKLPLQAIYVHIHIHTLIQHQQQHQQQSKATPFYTPLIAVGHGNSSPYLHLDSAAPTCSTIANSQNPHQ
ncbi:hypothetical protein BYT27DRAFT_7254292 [Phlegmacium glaucopus]|nr:hypothetical protein BYT27DRAFT_7254292 [Phlegmacium glaucopus]